MNNKKSLFDCPECGSPMKKMYSNEKAHEIAHNSSLASYLKIAYEFQLLRIFVCTKCGYNKELKASEILMGFVKMKKRKGLSSKEIIREVKKVKDETEKEWVRKRRRD